MGSKAVSKRRAGLMFAPLIAFSVSCFADSQLSGLDQSLSTPHSPVYLVAVSQQTFDDPAWRAVAETLAARHGGEVMTYSGVPFPVTLRGALAARRPEYVCFVAQPLEVTQAYVASAHQMLRQLDSDPYGDAVWGVVTGLAAATPIDFAIRATYLWQSGPCYTCTPDAVQTMCWVPVGCEE